MLIVFIVLCNIEVRACILSFVSTWTFETRLTLEVSWERPALTEAEAGREQTPWEGEAGPGPAHMFLLV